MLTGPPTKFHGTRDILQMMIDRGEHLFGDQAAVVGSPSPDDRVEVPDPPHGRRTGFDEQLAAVTADVAPQEVETLLHVDDMSLVLVEREASWGSY